jgi:hypothetical protein
MHANEMANLQFDAYTAGKSGDLLLFAALLFYTQNAQLRDKKNCLST